MKRAVLAVVTVLIGVFVLVTLAAHGSLFLAWKTEGAVHKRSRALALPLWSAVVALWVVATLATRAVSPEIFEHFPEHFLSIQAGALVHILQLSEPERISKLVTV